MSYVSTLDARQVAERAKQGAECSARLQGANGHWVRLFGPERLLGRLVEFFAPWHDSSWDQGIDKEDGDVEANLYVSSMGSPDTKPGDVPEIVSFLEPSPPIIIADGHLLFFRRKVDVSVVSSPSKRTVYFLGESDTNTELQARNTLRDQIFSCMVPKSWRLVHASAALSAEGVRLFVGDRGAGKTTCLLSGMEKHGWRYVSGDKVYLEVSEGLRLRAHGVAARCNIHLAALRANEMLAPLEFDSDSAHTRGDKMLVDAKRLAKAFATTVAAQGPVSHIYFPQVEPADAPFRSELLGLEETRQLVRRYQLDGNSAEPGPNWLRLLERPMTDRFLEGSEALPPAWRVTATWPGLVAAVMSGKMLP